MIHCDNKSAIAIARNPIHHGRTKHIELRFHFIRNLISDGSIDLNYCKIDDQVTNIVTKAFPINKHMSFRSSLGVCSFQTRGSVEELGAAG